MQLPRPRFPWKPRWFIDETVLRQEGSRSQGRKLTYQALELGTNNFSVLIVAALGFFTGTYVLFVSNFTLPMLGFVYWHEATNSSHETTFNNATTAGTIVGMLAFGILGDVFGRRKMYGYEIIVLIVGTMGVITSSTGYIPLDQVNNLDVTSIDYSSFGSMNLYSWLFFWRFLTGIGIGGEYPLTAVVAAEFAPTSARPRILAIVFSMQAFGVAAGATVSLVVTKILQAQHPYNSSHPEASSRGLDQGWRWVIGLTLIPAVITAVMRFTIPESPRYTLDVLDDPQKARQETERLRRLSSQSEFVVRPSEIDSSRQSVTDDEEAIEGSHATEERDVADNMKRKTLRQYFWVEGNWRRLFTTSLSWFMVDFGTQSLNLNATTLSKFWNGPVSVVKNPKVWDSDTKDPNASIFTILIANSVHSIVNVAVPSITGILLFTFFITHVNRRMLTWVIFPITGILYVLTGVALLETTGTDKWSITIVLYALCNCVDQIGIGPLTFMLPAELFPTRFRASCHGISAAFGKLGTVLASVFLRYVAFGNGENKITASSSPSVWQSYVLMIFAAPLFISGGVCWLWLPDLQDSSNKNKTLEELAEGNCSTVPEVVGT